MTDYEHSSGFPDGATVFINKVGGGTFGRAYHGEWEFEIQNSHGDVTQKSFISTGMPKTHVEVAYIILGFYESESESY